MFLSTLIVIPLVFALVVAFLPRATVRFASLGFTVVHFIYSLKLLGQFDSSTANLQMVEKSTWLPEIGVSYFLGVDGISLWLILLTTFLTPIVIGASWSSINKSVKAFHVALLVLEAAMIGSFVAMDSILFYVFFELSLIPMYFMVGIWGGENRIYATIKFFLYTMLGSLLMLACIIFLIFQVDLQLGNPSASVLDFYRLSLPFSESSFLSPQNLVFFVFCLAFAIKVPMFPFHTWLPDAHVQAPTGGSMILAGVMLKMGTYGFLRFVIPMFPDAVAHWSWLFLALGTFGIIYGALVAMVQVDMKKLVAYSSVSHMGYVIVGLFAMNIYGLQGGLFQMLAHGISTGALFMLVGVIYERTHSRKISEYGGLAKVTPYFAICFLIVTFSSIAVPLTNGFVGEFLILLGAFQAQPIFAYISVLGVILGATYMLWMVKKVFFGPGGPLINKSVIPDMNLREMVTIGPLLVLIFWMGLLPKYFLDFSETSLQHLLDHRDKYQLSYEVPPVPAEVKVNKTQVGVNDGI